MLDALARHFAGVPVEQAQPPMWIVTADNMPAEATEELFLSSRATATSS